MAIARLFATFILMLYFKDIHGQLGLGNKPGLGLNNCPLNSQQALQRKTGLISNPKTYNQISKTVNIGSNLIQQQNNKLNTPQTGNLQGINKQQTQNCQQQVNSQQQLNSQQKLNLQQQLNVQQPLNLNLQQSLPNQNVQSLNLQQPVNLQQQLLQQQNFPSSNLQIVPQQGCIQNEIPLSSLPTINGQFSGLPTQVSQGVLLSNLGLTSNLPNYLPDVCGQTVGQISQSPFQNNAFSQNNVVSNIPISLIDTSQDVNNLGQFSYIPVSFQANLPDSMSYSLSNDYNGVNNPSMAMMMPTSLQNTPTQGQQIVYFGQNSVASPNQPLQNELALTLQSQSDKQGQNLPVEASVKNQSPLPSFVLSPIASPQFSPSIYPTSSVMPQSSNQTPKSSGMKALLPFLLNMLKEKGPCCGCRPNNANCGCVNSNNPNFSNNIVQDPQVLTGYSNQVNFSPSKKEQKEATSNTIDSEEINSLEVVKKRKKHRKYKSKPESDEYEDDEEAEVYDNED